MNKSKLSLDDVEVITKCPVCNSIDLFIVSNTYLNDINFLEISICENCTFTFKTKRLSLNWYENLWSTKETLNNEQTQPTYRDKLRYKRYQNIQKIISKFTIEKQVIDLGTSSGYGLKSFFDNGWETTGVEPDVKSCNFGKTLGINMINQTIEKFVKSTNEQFSVILLIHSLEHFHSPVESLKHIAKLLKNNGFLYIEVPNMLESSSWVDCIDYHHLNYFYEYSLLKIIQQLGLNPILRLKTKTQPWGNFHMGILCQKTKPNNINSDKLDVSLIKKIFTKGVSRDISIKNYPFLYKINDIFDCDSVYLTHHQDQKFIKIVKTGIMKYLIKKRSLNLRSSFLNFVNMKYGIFGDKNFEKFEYVKF